jgi:hypothetical protein
MFRCWLLIFLPRRDWDELQSPCKLMNGDASFGWNHFTRPRLFNLSFPFDSLPWKGIWSLLNNDATAWPPLKPKHCIFVIQNLFNNILSRLFMQEKIWYGKEKNEKVLTRTPKSIKSIFHYFNRIIIHQSDIITSRDEVQILSEMVIKWQVVPL